MLSTVKKIFVLFLVVLLCLFHGSRLHAQDDIKYYFKSLDRNNGLSHNTVLTIMQDRNGFMWFGTKEGLNRFDGVNFRIFNKMNSGLNNDFITALIEDKNGLIWVGTDAGVFIYNPMLERFTAFDMVSDKGEPIRNSVTRIEKDKNNDIWIAVDYQGLFWYDSSQKKLTNYMCQNKMNYSHIFANFANVSHLWFNGQTKWVALYADNLYYTYNSFKTLTPFRDADGKETFKNDKIFAQIKGLRNCWYIGSANGLTEIDLKTRKVRKLISCFVRTLCFNGDKLWVGTETGIYIYDPAKETYTHLSASMFNDPYAINDNAIYSIIRDTEGGIWVGSYFGGINYCPHSFTYFEKFYPGSYKDLGKRVREFCSSNDGTIWIGTEDKGLFHFNPKNREITPFLHPLIYHNIQGLCLDGNNLWVGTFSGGLNRINLRTKQVIHYQKGTSPNSLNTNDVNCICKLRSGNLWIGTDLGMLRYNRSMDNFTRIREFPNINICKMLEDFKGYLWIATYAYGIFRYDIKNNTWKNYYYQKNDPASLPYDKVISLYEDSRKRLWFVTQGGGFCQYNPKTDKFIRHDMSDGFPSNTVYDMEEDQQKNLWLTTNNGLVCFNPDKNYRRTYTTDDGLLYNQFNYKSGYKDLYGHLYFGSINGFISFDPLSFSESTFEPPIVITGIDLFNNPVTIGVPHSPLKKSMLFSDKIELQPDQNSFSLHVAVLTYHSPATRKLMYKLDGFSDDWHEVGRNAIINYSHLPYGTYTLHLNYSNGKNHAKTERLLKIHIKPPFYLSGWAYAFYTILIILVTIGLYHYLRKRSEQKQRQLIEKMEREKERDLYSAKIDFFTNITHEIRTPLTLIKGPLENVLSSKNIEDEEIRENLEIMDLNTNRLLDLVNQLLDFRKAEMQGLRMELEECNIDEILKDVFKRFSSLAQQKGLDYVIEQSEKIQSSVDREALTKVMSNLFTNAIKYSETYIHIRLWSENGKFRLSVCNDGPQVPKEMREEIFKPFVQYRKDSSRTLPGTGIGLALTRSLVELHGGTLMIDDSLKHNCFIVTIPIRHEMLTTVLFDKPADEDFHEMYHDVNQKELESTQQVVLVIEDNQEMRLFICKQLSSIYSVFTAFNGVEALNVLKDHEVNLIVSDIMMPIMDGLELTQKLKSDVNLSHIPILLLTAKATLQAKIEGLKIGADAYIEKPFSVELLRTTISNLLYNRKKLREAFTSTPDAQANTIAFTEADEIFLKNLNQLIESNISDTDFDLDKVAAQLNMSRSSLNRKIKGILDITSNDYIRLQKMKKAAQLLKTNKYRINEVCYMVGFNTPSYFAKCFQKQFGVQPKDY